MRNVSFAGALRIAVAALLLSLTVPVGQSSAAELPSSGSSDEIRCRQSSVSGAFVTKCYVDVSVLGFDWAAIAGSVTAMSYNGWTSPGASVFTDRTTGSDAWLIGWVGSCRTGASEGGWTLYFGPLSGDPVVGTLPAGAFVLVCSSAFTYTNGGVTHTASTLTAGAPSPSSVAVSYCTSTNSTTCNGRNHQLVGTLDGYDGAHLSVADAIAAGFPLDWYPGGGPAVPPPSGCERLSFTGPSGSQLWRKGAPLTFTVSWETGNAPSQLWLRFPLSGLLSQYADGTTLTFGSGPLEVPPRFVPYALPGVSNVSDPTTSEWTFDGTESITIDQLGPDARASDLVIMCIFNDGEGVEFGFHQWDGESLSDVPAARQCSLLGIARPAAANDDGEFVVLFHAGIASGNDDVGPVSVDRWDGDSWESVFVDQTFGADDPPVEYVLDSLGQTPDQLRFRCEDADGYLEGGRITGGPGYVGVVVGGDGWCSVGDVGINPSSWLPAAGRLAGCVAELLVVPSDPGGWLDERVENFTGRAPFSFVADAVDFADVVTTPGGGSPFCFDSQELPGMGDGPGGAIPEVCPFSGDGVDAVQSAPGVQALMLFAMVGLTIAGFIASTVRMVFG
jgi:hypothetical protein